MENTNPPTIQSFPPMTFMGMKAQMSLQNNLTHQLWSSFMPRKKEIHNQMGTDLYSVEIYSPGYFNRFDPTSPFEKWAAVQVSSTTRIPDGMQLLEIPEGKYAVFRYQGTSSGMRRFYQYVFSEWLPGSYYVLDDRPHMAIMGKAYKNNDPSSEEDICIPICT